DVPGSSHGEYVAMRFEAGGRQSRQRLTLPERNDERLVIHAALEELEEHDLLIARPADHRRSRIVRPADPASAADALLRPPTRWISHERLRGPVVTGRHPSYQPLTVGRDPDEIDDRIRDDSLGERTFPLRPVDVLRLPFLAEEIDLAVRTKNRT